MAGAVLHWDFENAPVPRGVSVGRVVGEMRTLIHTRFGPLLAASAYACREKSSNFVQTPKFASKNQNASIFICKTRGGPSCPSILAPSCDG